MNNKDNKFTFNFRDEYQRKAIAEKIITLLTSGIGVSPLIINGGWGTGKTEFCRKLINLIAETQPTYKPIYIDAFAADHADEPLMTLLAAVLNVLPDADSKNSLIQKALPAIRFGLKTSLKAGVHWLLKKDVDQLSEDLEKELESASDKVINKSIESLLADHVKAEESLSTLRSALVELTRENEIVLFIDELDRCRPDFAISILENIKHVFGVDGVQIVLVTNINQLKSSISHCYGMDEDGAKRYLDKFVGFSLTLPQVAKDYNSQTKAAANLHFRGLVLGDSPLKDTWLQIDYMLEFLEDLIGINNLSLREVETLVKHFHIYQTITDGKGLAKNFHEGYQLLRSLGIFLYCVYPELLINKTVENLDVENILKRLGILYVPVNKDHYQPTTTQIVVMLLIFDNNLFKDKLDNLNEENLKLWRRWSYGLFGNGGASGNMNKYVIDASKILRFEPI